VIIMTSFTIVPTDRLLEICHIFNTIQWPAPSAEVIPRLMERLGWTWTGDPNKSVHVKTDLPVDFNTAWVFFYKGGLSEIMLRVTDSIPEGGDIGCVPLAYEEIVRGLGQVWGRPASRGEKCWWDLSGGGRVRVTDSERYVGMDLLSKDDADLERMEARLGISPDRVLGEDDEEAVWSVVVGLSRDGRQLQVVESTGGPCDSADLGQRVIGVGRDGVPVYAARGSTDYLSFVLATDPNLMALFQARPDIAEGIRSGAIGIRYSMVVASGDGTSTATDFVIDRDRLQLSHLGQGQGYV
jgi:hypothetical protein